MRCLSLLLVCLWANVVLAQETGQTAGLQAQNALLKARVSQLEAQLAESQSCDAAKSTADVGFLLGKLGAQEEAHAWAMMGLSDAPLVLPDSVLSSVVPNEYLVLSNETPEDLGLSGDQVIYRYDAALTGFAARLSPLERDSLRARQDVDVVENGRVFAAAGEIDEAQGKRSAEDHTTEPPFDPAVDVYLFDTGIRAAHHALKGRVAATGFSSFDNGIAGEDCSGHGTHVAARIAGRMLGVSDQARLISVKVMDAFGGGDVATVIKGIDWVMAQPHRAPSLVNMSFTRKHIGGVDPLEIALTRLMETGVVVVVAAGNASQDVSQFTPARISGVITVGSFTQDTLSSFSNAGLGVDVYAPGEAVTSASIRDVCGVKQMSGTSMAAPLVSGLVAQMLAQGVAARDIPDLLRDGAEVIETGALDGEKRRFLLSSGLETVSQICP